MKIDLYPTRIEAVDENCETLFYLETSAEQLLDEGICELTLSVSNTTLSADTVDSILDAIRRGVTMLGIEKKCP